MARRYCGGRHSAGSVARTACSALSSRQGWHDSGIFRILRLQDYSVPSLDLESDAPARTCVYRIRLTDFPRCRAVLAARKPDALSCFIPYSSPKKKKVLR